MSFYYELVLLIRVIKFYSAIFQIVIRIPCTGKNNWKITITQSVKSITNPFTITRNITLSNYGTSLGAV